VEQIEEESSIENEISTLNNELNALLVDTENANVTNIPADVIDPSLTMDWTIMNPPGLEGGIDGGENETEGGVDDSSSLDDETEPEITEDDDDDDDTVVAQAKEGVNTKGKAGNKTKAKDESELSSRSSAAGNTKEVESPPSKMDTEPERTSINATNPVSVVAGTAKEAETELDTIDTEPERISNNATSTTVPDDDGLVVAAKVKSQGNITSGATNETEAVVPPPEDDDDDDDDETNDGAGGETDDKEDTADTSTDVAATETSSPTQKNISTASPTATQATSSSPSTSPSAQPPKENDSTTTSSPSSVPTQGTKTSSPTAKKTLPPTPTYSPTVEYVEPGESLDPVANEDANEEEAFENGEEIPNTGDKSSSSSSTDDDNFFRESKEEEAKKVGGWLSLASIVLMIYTAYQMSENPDGICASLCRLVITVIGCIIKIILIPFKYIMGGGRPSGGHYMATPDYRDPYGSRHMELT
ncbi:hypothetical protein ACHAXR_003536, partial [Thalassiosira sp. AJA248-18]